MGMEKGDAAEQSVANAMERSMGMFNSCAQQFKTKEELAGYAMAMAVFGVALLRGIEGNKFAEGFLIGAVEDKNPMVIKPQLIN